ncbi:engulfment and cell motility protein 1 isoform X2 [Procambarus clarkii]|nr:engulfment and cell motility protein 1-like isoform X2 [Procambarus clarkii]XP_045608938.1 engulfment and cell motility protein 1-like isoform X2 [Procambarus clarkii]
MAPARDANVVKLAVEMRTLDTKPIPYLGEFSLQQPLAAFIVELCTHWKVDNPEFYALQYTEPTCHYVTEKNRGRIKDGTVLHLVYSAARTADDILQKLKKGPQQDDKKEALESLVKRSSDITFAHEFIAKQGISLLISCMEMQKNDSPLLPNILLSFLELMDHGIMPWDDLQPTFIGKMVSYINVQGTLDTRTLSTSLTILENIMLNSQANFTTVQSQIALPKLLHHISNNKKVEIQQSVLAVINALLQKSDPQKRKQYATTMSSRQYRTVLINNVLIHTESGNIGADMAHQLYMLQQLLLNQYEERMTTSMDANDQDATDKIKELRRIAFESDGDTNRDVTTRRPEYKKEYKKLGFRNDINPAQDFMDIPPGMLALDNMVFFARNHSDQYAKLVLENCYRADSHECPFGRASIELTKLLCEILQIGDVPTEQGQTFHPMFFSHDHAFEELFSICIVLLNKTWKEMKATTEDFSKVLSVVRDQITRTMNHQPSTLDNFRTKINNLTYAEIAEIWQQERINNEEQEMQAPPIKELRRQLEPEILELIQQHRLRFLVEGTRFKSARGVRAKDKFRYCRLSPNHKFFHYDDCDEKAVPSIDELGKKISIVDIKSIVTGKECPHMKDKTGKKNAYQLAFSLILESNNVNETNSVDFVAPDEMVFNYWVDGVNALLRQRMPSLATSRDLEMLLNMEIKLRLLDAEGVTIPQQQPVIPPPPPNYNFCYQLP